MRTTYAELLATNLRVARARANLSQNVVAARMNRLGFAAWDGSKVSRCERGSTPLAGAELLALSVALECTLNELTGGNTPPDALVAFPSGYEVSGVTVRNSVYGWRDQSVTWDDDATPRILRPADPQSARAWDQSTIIAITDPARLARRAS